MYSSINNIYRFYYFSEHQANQGFGESEDSAESEEYEESTELHAELQTIDYTEQLNTIIEYQEKIYNGIMCILLFYIIAFLFKTFFANIFGWLNGS